MRGTAADTLNVQDRCDCAVVADFLATSRCWQPLAGCSAALAAWLLARHLPAADSEPALTLMMVALLLGVERYLAVRLGLDRRLFERLAQGSVPDLAALDRTLARHFAMAPAKAGRALALRIAGARRLYRAHVGVVTALAGLALLAFARGT